MEEGGGAHRAVRAVGTGLGSVSSVGIERRLRRGGGRGLGCHSNGAIGNKTQQWYKSWHTVAVDIQNVHTLAFTV